MTLALAAKPLIECAPLDLGAGSQYPFVPPVMRFRSKVWHPNVSSANGAICLDILKDNWSPALTLKTALLSLQALLASPEPGDPQVHDKPHTVYLQPVNLHLNVHLMALLALFEPGRMRCQDFRF